MKRSPGREGAQGLMVLWAIDECIRDLRYTLSDEKRKGVIRNKFEE